MTNMKPRVTPVYYTLVPVNFILWMNEEIDRMLNDTRKMNSELKKMNSNGDSIVR